MKGRHNFALLRFDAKAIIETKKSFGRYYFIKIAFLFLGLQEIFAVFLFPDIWKVEKRAIIGLILIISEIIYLVLFFYVRKILSSSPLSKMFFQSVFLNLGVIINILVISPFILSAYLKGSKLFDYYLYGLLGMFFLALIYVIQLDCKQLIDNSLNKKNVEIITFEPDGVFWPLSRCTPIIWVPYVLGSICLIFGFLLRNGPKAEYYITSGMLICSATFLYSEFCYFWLWIKYRLEKISN